MVAIRLPPIASVLLVHRRESSSRPIAVQAFMHGCWLFYSLDAKQQSFKWGRCSSRSVAYLFPNPVQVKAADSQYIIHRHICVPGSLDSCDAVDASHSPLQPLEVALANLEGYQHHLIDTLMHMESVSPRRLMAVLDAKVSGPRTAIDVQSQEGTA